MNSNPEERVSMSSKSLLRNPDVISLGHSRSSPKTRIIRNSEEFLPLCLPNTDRAGFSTSNKTSTQRRRSQHY